MECLAWNDEQLGVSGPDATVSRGRPRHSRWTPQEMVARSGPAWTVAAMTTYTKRDLNRLAHTADTARVLDALMALGQERLNQEADGGPLYALFADYSWHTEAPLTPEFFALWLDGPHDDEELDPEQVAQACKALGVGS